jgi:integrase
MNVLRRFNNWSIRNEHTTHYAFSKYEPKSPLYGTPYFLTMDERNKLYKHLFTNPKLTIQRDIFIFQCCIGCRMGDLIKFTRSNVINNAIEYIASKTMEGRPRTVRVPLNEIAKEILNKYKDYSNDNDYLFPFANIHTYNYSIRNIFKEAGLDRMITKLNSKTRASEQKPLYEVASSHIARRTFIGNLYKQVPDPNLIGALSGHVEGSKSFARYRTIDEETKIGLVKLLE